MLRPWVPDNACIDITALVGIIFGYRTEFAILAVQKYN